MLLRERQGGPMNHSAFGLSRRRFLKMACAATNALHTLDSAEIAPQTLQGAQRG
ncbi:MAG: twin-arginine translocation signal domain-containing protein [Chromatiales bacterium]